MPTKTTLPLALLAAAMLLAAPLSPAMAAAFPEKSLQIIVPFSPGGGGDLLTRAFDVFSKDVFGHNFVLVYKPGAGSAVGTTAMAREKPDGYTIGLGSMPHMVLQPAAGSGRYTLDSFDYIAIVAAEPQIMVTPKGSPYKTYAQLKEAAKKAPGKLTLGIPSPLSETWLAYEMVNRAENLGFTVITYQGGADMSAALLGKQVDAGMANIAPYYGEIHNLNVLGVTAAERVAYLPDVPTFREMGVNVESYVERLFVAPKGIDPARLKVLREGFKKIWNNPEFQKRCADLRYTLKWVDGKDVPEYLKEQSRMILAVYEEFRKTQKQK